MNRSSEHAHRHLRVWHKATADVFAARGNVRQREAARSNAQELLNDLKSCSFRRDLQWGRRIHAKAVEGDDYIATALIKMYAKCGSMVDASRVFDRIRKPDIVCWTALLLGHADNGEGLAALELFSRMKARGCAPDAVTYVAVLKACTALIVAGDESGKAYGLKMGSKIHSEIDVHLDPFVQCTLVDMYAKCGSMVEARQVFDSMQKPDVMSWTALLLGYAENGEGHLSLDLFSKMKAEGCPPDAKTYVAALKACASLADRDTSDKAHGLEMGQEIHKDIGGHLNPYVQNSLVDMYSKYGSMASAHRVFKTIRKPDVVSWTALILGYADNGEEHVALDLFSKMKASECAPNYVTYLAVLKACGSIGALALGRTFHSGISEYTARVVSCLIDFYAKCGSLVEARAVFDLHSKIREVSAWNALLAGYSVHGDTGSVFNLFKEMQDDEGSRPNAVTFVILLLCCSHAGLVEKAREYLEAMPVQFKLMPDVIHYSCMVDVLGRANKLMEAVSLLRRMPFTPNVVTWRALLGACRKWKNVEIGRMAFESLPPGEASACVLMAQIYGSRGMRQEQERVLENRTAWKVPEQAHVVDEMGKMAKFVVGQDDPPEVQHKLAQLLGDVKEQGHSFAEREEAVCGHSERRAVAYGILKTPPGEQVRVFKNMRMCEGCHELTKMFAKLSGRVVMVRDTSAFHVMVNGRCSCGDDF